KEATRKREKDYELYLKTFGDGYGGVRPGAPSFESWKGFRGQGSRADRAGSYINSFIDQYGAGQ
ncbi:MAG: hypothetical protein U9R40_06435, partial [Synergistota bacterium]|nr:hypothetical protein [Synergistota bacterium]